MTQIDELISLLDKPDDEVWGNIWCEDAHRLFLESHQSLIPTILNLWRNWPVSRQEHLAFILGGTGSKEELSLIREMLSASSHQVCKRAKEALDEFEDGFGL